MESGQEITVGVWDEMVAQLAEVRAKRDQLQQMNLRVTDNLKRTIEERDKAVAEVESLRAEYLKHKEMANVSSDQAASLREQLQEIRAQRDRLGRYRDEARKAAADLQAELERVKENCGMANRMIEALQGDCDAAREDLAHAKEAADMWRQEAEQLQDTVHKLQLRQIPGELRGMLQAIHILSEQARELI
jgi:uncharacterized coiled-coil DUF342 family protein